MAARQYHRCLIPRAKLLEERHEPGLADRGGSVEPDSEKVLKSLPYVSSERKADERAGDDHSGVYRPRFVGQLDDSIHAATC